MEAAKNSSVTVLYNAVIVTMDSETRLFRNGGIAIQGDKIKSIGPSSDILDEFSAIADQIVDLQGQFLLPGFINTHVHTSQQLARGIADDVDLMTWLHHRIWPYESNMTEEDSYISTLLCGIELIHSGVTCFAEAGGQHVSGMARAVKLLGLRACLTQSIMDAGEGLPASWGTRTTEDCIQAATLPSSSIRQLAMQRINLLLPFCKAFPRFHNSCKSNLCSGESKSSLFFKISQAFIIHPSLLLVLVGARFSLKRKSEGFVRNQSQKELYMKHHDTADGRIRIWLGVRQIMNSTDRLLLETRDTAEELKTGIHMHVAEIPFENQVVMDTREVDYGTVTYLEKIKFLRSNLLAAHTVWVNETEIGFLSRAGVNVSHCPAAAMRMLGFAPIKEMLDSGICVSLGTDGAPSNNRMSIVDEMYLASLINKGREVYVKGTTDPTALPAEMILKMATVNGAKSVLWDNEIGSLEVGKKADMIVVNPLSWPMVPVHDRISSLVYSLRSENIFSVMCNGHWIMKNQKILNVDEEKVITTAIHASNQLLKRAGIQIPNRMKVL